MRNQWVFYIDAMDNVLYKVNMDGSNRTAILVTYNDGVTSISYDWTSKLIYYSDSLRKSIDVFHIDNANLHRQIYANLNQPTSVVIHVTRGYIFFAQAGRAAGVQPNITRCNANGDGCKVILSQEIGRVVGLTIDYDADNGNRLCWSDTDLRHIACCDIEGNTYHRLSITPAPVATAMTILDGVNVPNCTLIYF